MPCIDYFETVNNNDNLQIVSQLYGSNSQSSEKIDPYSKNGLLISEHTVYREFGLDKRLLPMITERTHMSNEEEWDNSTKFDAPYSQFLWNPQGELVGLYPKYLSQDDIELVNRLDNVRYFYPYGQSNTDEVLDFNKLSSHLPFRAIKLADLRVAGASRLCDYETAVYLEVVDSVLLDPIALNDCGDRLEKIEFSGVHIGDMEVSNLAGLRHLVFAGGKVDKLSIDGGSLAELRTISFVDMEMPGDLSGLKLPDGLIQIYLGGLHDSDLSNLTIPDSVEFVDLKSARLDDYRFLTTGKGIKHLRLRGSLFDQWDLLPELIQLEYLDLHGMAITDHDLEQIGKLRNLRYLNLSNTEITNEGLKYIAE